MNNTRDLLEKKRIQATIPKSYKEYMEKVNALKDEDANTSYGSTIVLTDEEEALDELMKTERQKLINEKYVYAVQGGNDGPAIYPPIHPFYEVKTQIEKNILFKVFKKMPKGGNLHIHTSATMSGEGFIKLLNEFAADGNQYGLLAYVYMIEDGEHELYTPILLPPGTVPPAGFVRLSECTADLLPYFAFVDPKRMQDIKYIWDEFNAIFSRVSYIMKVRKFFEEYYTRAMEEQLSDGIDYMELRFGTSMLTDDNSDIFPDAKPPVKYDPVRYFRQIYSDFQSDHKDSNFKVKLIISGSRRRPKTADVNTEPAKIAAELEKVKWWMDNVVDTDDVSPFVIGYDLVSEEDRGYATDEYAEAIFNSGYSQTIPFYFHDGESCWGDNDNLYSAYILGTKRVGHGINLYHFPSLVGKVKADWVALEVCPISNQLLRYTPDLRMHPIGEYLNRGIPCVICSDDPQIFNYVGLSYDFWEIYFSQLLDLKGLKALVLSSYIYSGMTDDEFYVKLEAMENKWAKFVSEAISYLMG